MAALLGAVHVPGAHVVEASDVYIYLRDEYPASREILESEIAKLPPGAPVLHMRRGAGAYICGEESSLLESLEGSFQQDLNGDGTMGIPAAIIKYAASTFVSSGVDNTAQVQIQSVDQTDLAKPHA